jgi:DNA modification methylase
VVVDVVEVGERVIELSGISVRESFAIHSTGITPIGNPTFDEWLACGKFIGNADRSVHFWVGDWLNYGEAKWGEMYEKAIQETGFDYQTLMDDKWVASRVKFSSRKENLSFSHHKIVAPYSVQEQGILLERAETLGLSVKQFRLKKDSLLPKGVQTEQWWQLGEHLIYCGDSSSEEFINRCKEAEASFAFADPPYNAGVAEWDNDFEWQHDYLSSLVPIVAVTPGISAIKDFMRKTNMPYKWSMSYWINNGMTRGALGFGNWIYVSLFTTEQSIYRNEQDLERIDIDDEWDREPVSITGGDRDPLKHKGRKPIRLMRHIIPMFTKEGETVIDPFLGTGTTLIACEKEGRICIGAELNVEYCESIIKRWERLTEQEAVLL